MPPDAVIHDAVAHDAVIHDLGYRHLEVERGGRGTIVRALVVDGLRAAFGLGRGARSKVVPAILTAIMCLPALGIVAASALAGGDELVAGYPGYLLNLQIVITVFVAAQAPVLVSRDLRFGVMALYLSRPLLRRDYVAGRYAAMAGALGVLTTLPLTLMLLGALVVGLPLGGQLGDYLRAVAGAGVLSLLLAGIGLVIAAVTPRRGIAVAAVVTVLVVLAGVEAIAHEVAIEEGADAVAGYLSLLSPYTMVDAFQQLVLGASSPLAAPQGPVGALVVVAAVIALLGACTGALLLRYRSVSVR